MALGKRKQVVKFLNGLNMAQTITDILALSPVVTVKALTAVPDSNDPANWKTPPLPGYADQTCQLVCSPNGSPTAVTFRGRVTFTADGGASLIVAVGVLYQGSCLCVALLSPAEFLAGGAGVTVDFIGSSQGVLA